MAGLTANADRVSENDQSEVTMCPNNQLSDIFKATVQATEEAIVSAMVAAETVTGASQAFSSNSSQRIKTVSSSVSNPASCCWTFTISAFSCW